MNAYDALDDFAGPGGWDEGARTLELRTIGVEHDLAACQTATAAGHDRIRVDVAGDPCDLYTGIPGYIASPPCTLFSTAGSGVGNLVIGTLTDGIRAIFAGDDPAQVREKTRATIYPTTLAEAQERNANRTPAKRRTPEELDTEARRDAATAALILEPARRIVELEPEWVALEQVPAVLPLWRAYVCELRAHGYAAWTAVLNAADYGVPQTRRRAVLGASRTRNTHPPEPTHSEHGDDGDLFGRTRHRWVSMADALGWGFDEPSATVSAGGAATGGAEPFANAEYRRRLREYVVDRRQNSAGPRGTIVPAAVVAVTRPAPTLTGKSGTQWVIHPPGEPGSPDRTGITPADAGVLQSFPRDYPWHGTQGKRYEQAGNAVPPLLAAHVLAAITGREAPR